MTKSVGLVVVILALLFAAVALYKARSPTPTPTETLGHDTVADRETVESFWTLYRAATDHRIAGRSRAALAAYEQALQFNDRHEDALYYLGNVYLEQGRYVDAKRSWVRLIRVNPMSARAHSRLGELHFCFPDPEILDLAAAERETERALTINKEETGPLLRLGQIALLRNDLSTAGTYFDQVIASNVGSVDAYFYRGYVVWKAGSQTEAARWLARARDAARPDTPAHGVLGEGDTKPGASTASLARMPCETTPGAPSELATLGDDDIDGFTNRSYAQLDARLARTR